MNEALVVGMAELQELLQVLSRQPEKWPECAVDFDECVASTDNPELAILAAQTIEAFAGKPEGQRAMRSLLKRWDSPEIVARAAAECRDPALADALLSVATQMVDYEPQVCALRSLVRLGDRRALPLLVEKLSEPRFRCEAVRGLGQLQDPAALVHLRPLLNDQSKCHVAAEFGDVTLGQEVTVGEVASEAVQRLSNVAPSPEAFLAFTDEDQGPPSVTSQRPEPRRSMIRPRLSKPNLPARLAPVPLVLAAIQLLFTLAFVAYPMSDAGHAQMAPSENRNLTFLLLAPAALGSFSAIFLFVFSRGATVRQLFMLVLGGVVCGVGLYGLSTELFK